jgi:hypothetical protein
MGAAFASDTHTTCFFICNISGYLQALSFLLYTHPGHKKLTFESILLDRAPSIAYGHDAHKWLKTGGERSKEYWKTPCIY